MLEVIVADRRRNSATRSTERSMSRSAPASPIGPHMFRPPAVLFSVPIADLTMSETVRAIEAMVETGRSTGRTHQIATVNVDFVVNAVNDAEVGGILRRCDLCLADGMPIVWASRMLDRPIRERVAGADLVPELLATAERTGWRIHIFGSTVDVARSAERILRDRYPRARFTVDPGPVVSPTGVVDDEVIDSIVSHRPDILCVALGNPKQERFIAANRERLGVPVMIGVGGSIDMLVGRRRRAPAILRQVGLEWVVRALQEPRRLGPRYLRDAYVFVPRLFREWRERPQQRGAVGLSLDRSMFGAVRIVTAGTSALPERDWGQAIEDVASGARITIDVADVSRLRDDALAQLVGLVRFADMRGVRIDWSPSSPVVRSRLSQAGVDLELVGLRCTGDPTA